ncbi:hypothetical protein H920_17470 [Fukomys damarensis]|uniref:Uncharacterized protein n=1 Tax=Fukomys damarensis TaxID=885580 RepID=A0A091CS50_FUKDA|nr:hypothetical protein H920_17470 [Fukomys damarensis]
MKLLRVSGANEEVHREVEPSVRHIRCGSGETEWDKEQQLLAVGSLGGWLCLVQNRAGHRSARCHQQGDQGQQCRARGREDNVLSGGHQWSISRVGEVAHGSLSHHPSTQSPSWYGHPLAPERPPPRGARLKPPEASAGSRKQQGPVLSTPPRTLMPILARPLDGLGWAGPLALGAGDRALSWINSTGCLGRRYSSVQLPSEEKWCEAPGSQPAPSPRGAGVPEWAQPEKGLRQRRLQNGPMWCS